MAARKRRFQGIQVGYDGIQGVAQLVRQLLQGGMEIARADGLSVLRLDTFPYNVRGRGLYESCGFADKGEWTVYYPALGDIQVIMYELPL